MKDMRKQSIVFIPLISAMFIFSLSTAFAQSGIYTLQVRPINAINAEIITGVDIQVYNSQTGARLATQYESLPPSFITMQFVDSEMPPYSPFSVCAYYHSTKELIECSYYRAGLVSTESVTIDLNPFN